MQETEIVGAKLIRVMARMMYHYYAGQVPEYGTAREYLESNVPIAVWGDVYDLAKSMSDV